MALQGLPQFFWMWAPINFSDCVTYFATNEDSSGLPWNRSGSIQMIGDDEPTKALSVEAEYEFKSGTRHVKRAVINYKFPKDTTVQIKLEPQYQFYMAGLGYSNPNWGHAHYKGDDITGYESYDLANINENEYQFLHIQAFVKAEFESNKLGKKSGVGVLEQTLLGPHEPTAFKEIYDMAP